VLNNALLAVAALALMEGRFAEAKRLAAEARAAGNEANEAVALGYQAQMASPVSNRAAPANSWPVSRT
jgi:hypothetical protein